MIGQWTNHLWQSTIFAVVVAIVTLAFRQNRAHVRYWLWLSASVKFLVPFALLMNLGNSLWTAFAARQIATKLAPPDVSLTVQQIAQPFTRGLSFAPSAPLTHIANWIPIALLSVWICGFLGVVLGRFRGWLRIRGAMRASTPMDIQAATAVHSSPGLLEPGVVGVLHPVLLLPQDILNRLSPSQLDAVLAHELSHVRRRDNLTAAIHMVVEAFFWFHPFVWWIGARLVEERERACDEAVLSLGGEPRDYADAIVSVCKLYVESPLTCVSGISGADLKKRIVRIMARHVGLSMSLGRKLLLGAAALMAVVVPVVFGALTAMPSRAQSQPQNTAAPLPRYEYETATIKPSKGPAPGGKIGMWAAPDGFSAWFITPQQIISIAYGVKSFQVSGGPSWLPSERFDIEAKMDAATADALGKLSQDQRALAQQQMLQALLADRFQLTVHRETKELTTYL
jgi:beta-lactamase regulating signal transducer with metallopeptidase domain